jgi:TPR repeat protein
MAGESGPRDDEAAIAILEPACRNGGVETCTLLGWATEHGRGRAANASRADELYTRGCARGSARGCGEAARMLEGRDPQEPRIAELYSQACTGAYLPACVELGRKSEAAGDSDYARRLYQWACSLHESTACVRIGSIEEHLPGTAMDALAHYEQACTDAPDIGCRWVGLLYMKGGAPPRDPAKAFARFKTGCDAGDLEACAALGDLYRSGGGTPRDPARAVTLYDRACSGKVAWACVRAAEERARARHGD